MHDGAGVGHFLLMLSYLLTINYGHFPHFHSILGAPDKGVGSYTYSSGTSIASSECGSDDLYNDDDETFLQNIHLSSCLLADLQTSDISGMAEDFRDGLVARVSGAPHQEVWGMWV